MSEQIVQSLEGPQKNHTFAYKSFMNPEITPEDEKTLMNYESQHDWTSFSRPIQLNQLHQEVFENHIKEACFDEQLDIL